MESSGFALTKELIPIAKITLSACYLVFDSVVTVSPQHNIRHCSGNVWELKQTRTATEELGKMCLYFIMPLQICLFSTFSNFFPFRRSFVDLPSFTTEERLSKWCPRPENNLNMTHFKSLVRARRPRDHCQSYIFTCSLVLSSAVSFIVSLASSSSSPLGLQLYYLFILTFCALNGCVK